MVEFTGLSQDTLHMLDWGAAYTPLIVEKGTDAKYGARPLRRALQTELEDKLAEAILNGEVKSGDYIEAGTVKKTIRFIQKEKTV